MRFLPLLALLFAATPAIAAPNAAYTDYATTFVDLADATATQSDQARVVRFHATFDPLLPGFYTRDDAAAQARLDDKIAATMRAFPEHRAGFLTATASFAAAFAAGQAHFRRSFPDCRLTMPVYLIHSFGQMDGGTRSLAGRPVMLFGADMLAQLHDATTIGPFLDHELFHIYHARFFPDCDAVWCSLWQEGLAVYVAQRMNPGASDRALELVYPRPIRPEIMPHVPAAMCFLRARYVSTKPSDGAPLFDGKANTTGYPPRFGYLLGALLADKIGAGLSLDQLAKLPPDQVKRRLAAAIDSYGPC